MAGKSVKEMSLARLTAASGNKKAMYDQVLHIDPPSVTVPQKNENQNAVGGNKDTGIETTSEYKQNKEVNQTNQPDSKQLNGLSFTRRKQERKEDTHTKRSYAIHNDVVKAMERSLFWGDKGKLVNYSIINMLLSSKDIVDELIDNDLELYERLINMKYEDL